MRRGDLSKTPLKPEVEETVDLSRVNNIKLYCLYSSLTLHLSEQNQMKKPKIKQRVKNSVNAFFDNGREKYGENSLSFVNHSDLLNRDTISTLHAKGDSLVKILKQTLIFLPGVLYLFFGTMFSLWYEFFRQDRLTVLVVFLIGSFMTIFGIGNLKNPKHLVIPLSIIAVGLTVFSLFLMLGKLKYIFKYGIYIFPLALIVPFIAKDLVDKTDTAKD